MPPPTLLYMADRQCRDLLGILIPPNDELLVTQVEPDVIVTQLGLQLEQVLAHEHSNEAPGNRITALALGSEQPGASENLLANTSPVWLSAKQS